MKLVILCDEFPERVDIRLLPDGGVVREKLLDSFGARRSVVQGDEEPHPGRNDNDGEHEGDYQRAFPPGDRDATVGVLTVDPIGDAGHGMFLSSIAPTISINRQDQRLLNGYSM